MFELANNKRIGKYLSNLIRQQFKSTRQFGIAYIEEDDREADNEEIRKMSNRLSQILNGKKSVQIYDLPIFTKLLGVSCEEILSAGECFTPTSNHLTNYAIAFSKDEKTWDEYVHRDDTLILNADEYGKTVIDYALEFKNYELLKYLTNNKYIWFVGADEKDYFANFGAGTSIKSNFNFYTNINILNARLYEKYELRMKMILLAIEHSDIEMLTELRAREIPSLYQACYLSCTPADCEKYYNQSMVIAIENASDKILEYFSEEFEIKDRFNRVNKFMFPFTSKLIDLLIQNNNDYAERLLKSAISHNQYVYDKLSILLKNTVNSYKQKYFTCESVKDDIIKGIVRYIDFDGNGNMISYRNPLVKDRIITNIIQAKVKSGSDNLNLLIEELNDLYNQIRNIKPIITQEV